MITNLNSEDRLVQQTFADHLRDELGWESVYAWNQETFGADGTLGRESERDAVLKPHLRRAMRRLNDGVPDAVIEQALEKLTAVDRARSTLQHNQAFYDWIRDGVPMEWRDLAGRTQQRRLRVLDFDEPGTNRFVAVRELKLQGLDVPHYDRRADLIGFVNGLPLVFIELKAVYVNIRAGFDQNLTDYLHQSIPHAFHHNAFLVVSNGDAARYGSITSRWEHFAEWKRLEERDRGSLAARTLLDGMLAKDRLLDIVRNFVLFDASKADGTRKIVARNHQVLGVNRAVASAQRQEALKLEFPASERVRYRLASAKVATPELPLVADDPAAEVSPAAREEKSKRMRPQRTVELLLPERAHPDLGRLGVFWHTQGSGKSYSMAFFAEKVRRCIRGSFTFVIITDREDLDDQIWRTFVGCRVADEKSPRASSGKQLQALLKERHRYVFSLVHKFNQTVREPYSTRDDIIVLSDEAHRTQAGKFARNMRMALPNASFIGFTGTPLLKHDELTRRIFGDYVSRYDFARSVEDGATVRLVYQNRGEQLGITHKALNADIYDAIEQADLDQDQTRLLERLLGKQYEVLTGDKRLDDLADDFVPHCVERFETGKSLLVCVDKITCGRMYERIRSRWQKHLEGLRAELAHQEHARAMTDDQDAGEVLHRSTRRLRRQIAWMEETVFQIIVSDAQNEVKDFADWGVDIKPHRHRMKQGFELENGNTLAVDDAFKDPEHPFRIAIVCAMWLTGFDVECLATLYLDKPMKAHTLMQGIARANRVYPGKDCGVIVDYYGMLQSLKQAMADYAEAEAEDGEDGDDGGDQEGSDDPLGPIEERVGALLEAIEAAEAHLKQLGFDPLSLIGAKGFDRIQGLKDARDRLSRSDAARRRFEIMASVVFSRFKALLGEPSAYTYAERHDNLEAIYRKLGERVDKADVRALLKELHRIVNLSIDTTRPGADEREAKSIDLSRIDFKRLHEEFGRKIGRPYAAVRDIRDLLEDRLQALLAQNPQRMNYQQRYQEIVDDYNAAKDQLAAEEALTRLLAMNDALDAEEQRAAREHLSEDELALFDLLGKDTLPKQERESLKRASRRLLAALQQALAQMPRWTENPATQAELRTTILDELWRHLPRTSYSDADCDPLTEDVYAFVWQRSVAGPPLGGAAPS